jgi:hypothetical protein
MHVPARLVVGPRADELRRVLGPAAWAALEVLAAGSEPVDGDTVVVAAVRETASILGLSKNATHRAVRRLVAAGLAVPDQRRADDGRYLTGRYRLTIPADVLTVTPATADRAPGSEPLPAAPRRRRAADRSGQLDLLLDAG